MILTLLLVMPVGSSFADNIHLKLKNSASEVKQYELASSETPTPIGGTKWNCSFVKPTTNTNGSKGGTIACSLKSNIQAGDHIAMPVATISIPLCHQAIT